MNTLDSFVAIVKAAFPRAVCHKFVDLDAHEVTKPRGPGVWSNACVPFFDRDELDKPGMHVITPAVERAKVVVERDTFGNINAFEFAGLRIEHRGVDEDASITLNGEPIAGVCSRWDGGVYLEIES